MERLTDVDRQDKFYSKLNDAQRERIECLIEEASEVIKCCTKIQRHGFGNHHPDNPSYTNRKHLEDELLQLWTVMERMIFHGEINRLDYTTTGVVWKKMMKWMRYQPPFHSPFDPPVKK